MQPTPPPNPQPNPQPAPLTALPPRVSPLRQRIYGILGILMFAGLVVAMAIFTVPPLITDWQISRTAEPAEHGQILKGSCSTKLILAICDVTLTNRTKAGIFTRSVNYAFIDLHFGDYTAQAMADPARPELITTDLALDKLWNRTLTVLVVTGFMLFVVIAAAQAIFRRPKYAR